MAKIKIIQFGEGNFLRAFFDYAVEVMNRRGLFDGAARVFNVRKTGSVEALKAAGCSYRAVLRGVAGGKAVSETIPINSIAEAVNPYSQYEEFASSASDPDIRFVVSNTTEAGIYFDPSDSLGDKPPASFPAKLAQLLFRRYEAFSGDASKGWIVLPCELLERNGDALLDCVKKCARHWNLPEGFFAWLGEACVFCNTLVDRIVSGRPAPDDKFISDASLLADPLTVVGEPYMFWAVESPRDFSAELPLDKCGLNIIFTPDIAPYRARKVVLLNAPHTLMAAIGLLSGVGTVREAVQSPRISAYLQKLVFGELIETLDLPRAELETFARDVLERFANPYLEHKLSSIASNAGAKCGVRVAPPCAEYLARKGALPRAAVFGLAANAAMIFKNRALLPNSPEAAALEKISDLREFAKALASAKFFAGTLAGNADFAEAIARQAEAIEAQGAAKAMEEILDEKTA